MTTIPKWTLAYNEAQLAIMQEIDEERRELLESMATDLLWRWTGRRFGTRTEIVRPCRVECAGGVSTFWGHAAGYPVGWASLLMRDGWEPVLCGVCSGQCSCDADTATALELPGPVVAVTEVIESGVTVAPEDYRLLDGVLYRLNGGTWRFCQNPADDPTDPEGDAWQITYTRGREVPAAGQIAAATLAVELAKADSRDNTCQLPRRLQSITREGVSMTIMDDFAELEKGRTGIWLIDSWVSAVSAPSKLPGRVYSPDLAPQRDTLRAGSRGRSW